MRYRRHRGPDRDPGGAGSSRSRSYADRSGTTADVLSDQTVATQYGPLSALDKDFVTRVRLAGLWELPAGQQAEEKGTTAAVRTAGQHLIDGHTFLDERVRDVAAKLGCRCRTSPTHSNSSGSPPSTRHRAWTSTAKFANILRLAHGKVFTLVAQVRATTQNSLVRALADDANTTVLDHIKVLEATGYVDFAALGRDMAASSTPAPTTSPAASAPFAAPGQVVLLTPSVSPTYSLPPPASSPPPSTQP
ncbi:DUF4142 domain-containing protein [Streptomyces sp. L7]